MNNETYSITPKGIFFLSLLRADLIEHAHDEKAEAAWDAFCILMEEHGYTKNKNEAEIINKLP